MSELFGTTGYIFEAFVNVLKPTTISILVGVLTSIGFAIRSDIRLPLELSFCFFKHLIPNCPAEEPHFTCSDHSRQRYITARVR